MLHTLKDMQGYSIHAAVDDVGKVVDYYFDDEKWAIRYLILETGSWLNSRKVLLSPFAITSIHHEDKTFSVSMNSEQVKHSPSIDTALPVSRQHEAEYARYYGYPFYWNGDALWGLFAHPMLPSEAIPRDEVIPVNTGVKDHHLRSCESVIGHHVEATDGAIGHIEQILIDEETWAIRYFVVNTSNWGLGHKVLIAPQWINTIVSNEEKVMVDLTQETIKTGPVFKTAPDITEQLEKDLFLHYGRKGYWE